MIELMITVAIVSILAAIALPSYLDSVRKGKRAEGRAALTELMQQQERYFTQHNTYLLSDADANGETDAAFTTTFKAHSGDSSASPAYDLKAIRCTDPLGAALPANLCIQLVAEPRFTDPAANKLTLMSTGKKDCDGDRPAICWK